MKKTILLALLFPLGLLAQSGKSWAEPRIASDKIL